MAWMVPIAGKRLAVICSKMTKNTKAGFKRLVATAEKHLGLKDIPLETTQANYGMMPYQVAEQQLYMQNLPWRRLVTTYGKLSMQKLHKLSMLELKKLPIDSGVRQRLLRSVKDIFYHKNGSVDYEIYGVTEPTMLRLYRLLLPILEGEQGKQYKVIILFMLMLAEDSSDDPKKDFLMSIEKKANSNRKRSRKYVAKKQSKQGKVVCDEDGYPFWPASDWFSC